jgi:hypothetical protein
VVYKVTTGIWRVKFLANNRILNSINVSYLQLDEGTSYRVTGLAYLEDPECYDGGSVATGRVSIAGQDEGEMSDEE